MNREELQAYIDRHRNQLLAAATEAMEEEDGRWVYWGDVAMCVYYETWGDSLAPYYRIVVFPLKETKDGMMEEDMDFFIPLAQIKTQEAIDAYD